MEEGPVEKLRHNGVDTQIAFANFSEIRRLYITQNGKFSLMVSLKSAFFFIHAAHKPCNLFSSGLATMMIEIEAENSSNRKKILVHTLRSKRSKG
ncbi:hypothetical protein T01_8038 [Trichinella spiralis]|uniref:Uncharacterized protein n=1 Tax=Trichinella spiralis TaxID=6334 RepID=A0A0V1C1X5_TRISP|nr:hypothetical protein T01_8038 [Trichinella spiralis]